jgi:16S rRNA (guanine1207-N2)-methyltransferase
MSNSSPLIQTKLRNKAFKFHTTWGLFSPKEIDHGTKVLIELIETTPDAHILDLGCGYGPIGITLAKDAPKGEIHMIDKDFVAIEYTEKNIKENRLKNCQTYLSNAFSHVPKDKKFDLIVSNIPAKVGKDLLQIIIADAKARLNPGGKFYVVTIAGLKEFIKRNFKETFGNYKKLKQSKGYCVAVAEKQE